MNLSHGKYLGVDYGDVRTGLAECDPTGLISSGIGTIKEGGMRKTAIRVAKDWICKDSAPDAMINYMIEAHCSAL